MGVSALRRPGPRDGRLTDQTAWQLGDNVVEGRLPGRTAAVHVHAAAMNLPAIEPFIARRTYADAE
ncbi:hypothetical protein ACFWWT_48255 [Streptomyces sp. NPDC058676]|uniref:hypothetical protein n=1 Tax=unclassified Streptomyces TaxID=2593676 RepID=UPI003664762B